MKAVRFHAVRGKEIIRGDLSFESGKGPVGLRPLELGVDLAWERLGLKLKMVERSEVSQANAQLQGGMKVVAVRPDSPAAKGGICRGDILVGLHTWETTSRDSIAFVLGQCEGKKLEEINPLRFYVVRGSVVHRGWLQLESGQASGAAK